MGDFSHLSERGEAAMVRLGAKPVTERSAHVRGLVQMSSACVQRLTDAAALEIARTARIAGIQGAKQTAQLIPLCHPLALTGVDLAIELDRGACTFTIEVRTETQAPTGVEMEAMCAASVAALTIYDMIKAVDPAATIGPMRLSEKLGGKHGRWVRHD